jgi:hypothetical protein
MYDNYNYPIGSDTSNAPWNQESQEYKRIKVTVSITLSKYLEIDVNDYTINKDEFLKHAEIDFSDCDLKTAVKEQHILPNEAFKYVDRDYLKKELKNWIVDDLEVILDD